MPWVFSMESDETVPGERLAEDRLLALPRLA